MYLNQSNGISKYSSYLMKLYANITSQWEEEGVDLTDQYISSYSFTRTSKSIKYKDKGVLLAAGNSSY